VVTVTNVNEGPEVEDDAAATLEDEAVTVDVLANDTDPDGDSLRVEAVLAPAHGGGHRGGRGRDLNAGGELRRRGPVRLRGHGPGTAKTGRAAVEAARRGRGPDRDRRRGGVRARADGRHRTA